ncbi:MAG: four helix bundle protein [Gemmatimonadaceae bacterium]
MASSIRDLRVWQEAVALAGEVVRTLRPAARREVAPIVTRIMTTAFDAAAAIADGYARHDPMEQRRRYAAARRDLVKLDTDLAVARQAEFLAAGSHAILSDRIQVVQRILAGYLVYLDRQLELPPGVTRLHPAGALPAPTPAPARTDAIQDLAPRQGSSAGAAGPASPAPAPLPLPGAAPRMAVRESLDEVDGA